MSKFQLQFSLLKYTGLFFVLLTALTVSTFLTPPKNISLASSKKTENRQPSSVFSIHNFSKSQQNIQNPQEQEFYSFSLNCESLNNKDDYIINSKGKNIRFKSTCLDNTWLSVTNTSNNHSGQVLKVNSQEMLTSDFIRLLKGRNVVQLLLKDADGRVTKKSFSVIY